MSKKDAVPPRQTGKQNANGPMPGVRQHSTMPDKKSVQGMPSATARNSGQTARSPQGEGGDTSARTDGGGNSGNSSEALHRKIFGK